MNEIMAMIRNLIDMSCEHIMKGYITKEFAGNAMGAFIDSLKTKGDTDSEIQLNRMLDYWSKWSKIYIENLNIGGENG